MSADPAGRLDFDPPSSYAFEPEFLGPPPRTLAEELDRGAYARQQRATIVGLAAAGALCMAAARLPGVDELARYVLPLGFLDWIGLALLALAAIALVRHSLHRGPYAYVRDGLPLVARVLELAKAPTAIVNGSPASYALFATVALRHPESGQVCVANLRSNDFSAGMRERYDTPFRVGDHVTVVYLPGRFDKTLRLYAFLELTPRHSLRSEPAEPEAPLKVVALAAGLAGLFLVLFANVYAFGRYHPLDFDYWSAAVPMAIGGLVLGGGLLLGLHRNHRHEQARAAAQAAAARAEGRAAEAAVPFLGTGFERAALAVALALGAPLLGAATTLCWCFMANAWLDSSPARPVTARVEAMTQTTHAFVLREYQIELSLAGTPGRHKLLTTPEQLERFASREAVAHVRGGRFGWPWIADVSPER